MKSPDDLTVELEDNPMSRKPATTRLAVALQAASLLVVAGGVFTILISHVIRHRTDVARTEPPPPHAQLIALSD
jgi:hypothetical protein